MTNDERTSNDEFPKRTMLPCFRILDFGFPWSFVLRISGFLHTHPRLACPPEPHGRPTGKLSRRVSQKPASRRARPADAGSGFHERAAVAAHCRRHLLHAGLDLSAGPAVLSPLGGSPQRRRQTRPGTAKGHRVRPTPRCPGCFAFL